MPYILYKSNGVKLATIEDGSIDSTTASLTFVGKNYAGYGETLNQNMVKLLENFANVSSPKIPLVGQLWYDTANKQLKIYNGTKYRFVQNFDTGNTTPTVSGKGDLWFNEAEQKLYLYNGTRYIAIGPQESQFSDTQLVAAAATDTFNNNYNVLEFKIADANSGFTYLPAIVSKDEFVVSAADELHTKGYKDSPIKSGITLPNTNSDGVSYPNVFWGTAGSSLGLYDKLTGIFHKSADYLLSSDYQSDLASGLNITNDAGVTIGNPGVFKIHADSGNSEGKITAIRGNKITFALVKIDTQTTTTVLTLNQNVVIPNTTWGINLGSTSSTFNNIFVNTVTTQVVSAISVGAQTVTANTVTANVFVGQIQGNITGNVRAAIVTATNYFSGTLLGPMSGNVTTGLIQATGGQETSTAQIKGVWSLVGNSKFQATYAADLAEFYEGDAVYEPGTVVVIGGDKEVTMSSTSADIRVAGVISENAAYEMYAACPGHKNLIALKGRIPCKVVGPINKGDLLITSNVPGHAMATTMDINANAVIGKALESFDSESLGVIEIKV
jgi:hypothetical protein